MRTFIAVPCPQGIRERLFKLKEEFAMLGDMKFVEGENMHLTVKFLGEIDEKKAGEVTNALAGMKRKPFELSIMGLGAFPGRDYPNVLWAGVDKGKAGMLGLHDEVERVLGSLGFEKEREFLPHLTIARVKNLKDKTGFLEALDRYSNTEFGAYQANRVDFMESRLSKAGPSYYFLSTANLKLI